MAVHPRHRHRSGFRWGPVVGIVLAALLGAALLDASDDGKVNVPWPGGGLVFQLFTPANENTTPVGKIAVPMSGRAIPAYTKVSRNDVWDPQTGAPRMAWLSPEAIERSNIVVALSDVIGRVLADEKPDGYVFTEDDFLPEGTRPGIVAGIPVGKRALRLQMDKVEGLVGLVPGDHFDLLAIVPIDEDVGIPDSLFSGPFADQMRLQASLGNLDRQASVRLIVNNGVVVSGLENRMVPVTSTTLTRGTTTRTRPVQEMVVALAPDEVPKVLESLGLDLRILCVPRSGRPDEDHEGVTPSSDPSFPFWGPAGGDDGSMTLIETIDGNDRSLRPVPRSQGARSEG